MSNPGNQNTQQPAANKNPNLVPDALQGTDDTQSEFSVEATRQEQRGEEKDAGQQSASNAPPQETNTAVTQSEFSVNERLRGNA